MKRLRPFILELAAVPALAATLPTAASAERMFKVVGGQLDRTARTRPLTFPTPTAELKWSLVLKRLS